MVWMFQIPLVLGQSRRGSATAHLEPEWNSKRPCAKPALQTDRFRVWAFQQAPDETSIPLKPADPRAVIVFVPWPIPDHVSVAYARDLEIHVPTEIFLAGLVISLQTQVT